MGGPHPRRRVLVERLRRAGCVFAEDEADLLLAQAHDPATVDALAARRAAGEPLEQVLGWALFCGQRIIVEPGVFVPRRRTEFLVSHAVSACRPGAVVVDLCCGCGAVAAALAAAVPGLDLHAADLDPVAVRCAERNLNGRARVYAGDLFDALPPWLRGTVDVLVVNAPYVPTAEIDFLPAEARLHEPRLALDGGADGLDVQRRVASRAASWLAPGGVLLIEVSERQAPVARRFLQQGSLVARIEHAADLEATVIVAALPPTVSQNVAQLRDHM